VGESFDGYSKKDTTEDDDGGAGSGAAAGEGGSAPSGGRDGAGGVSGGRDGAGGASGGRGGAGGASGGRAGSPGGQGGDAVPGLGGDGGLEGGQGGDGNTPPMAGAAGAGGDGSTTPSCPPPAPTLITDMETASVSDPSYANIGIANVPSGIRASGFFCGATPYETGTTEPCGSAGFPESSITVTTKADEVHCGKRALKAVADATPKLLVSLDLDAAFANASDYAGVRLWAKGTGPFVPGLTNGGDWYDLPALDPNEWQEYTLLWADLEYPHGTPWTFNGNLAAASNDEGHKLAFQVWDVGGAENDFTLLLDDISFVQR
jgi:hypothetical protein